MRNYLPLDPDDGLCNCILFYCAVEDGKKEISKKETNFRTTLINGDGNDCIKIGLHNIIECDFVLRLFSTGLLFWHNFHYYRI